jgi:Glycosyltransferase family 87
MAAGAADRPCAPAAAAGAASADAWLLPLFTGVSLCLGIGQNAVLLTLLLGAGLLLLERRALLAGCCLGLLACKPQLALLVGPALLVAGHYRALAAMAATVLTLAATSTLAFGMSIWPAFFQASSWMSAALASGELKYTLMATIFAAARMAGLSVTVAGVLQGAVTVTMLACVVQAWRRPLPFWLRSAILAAAMPLATPYACGYDLALLALPLAWLAREHQRAGGQAPLFEFCVLMLAWLAPAAGWILAEATGVLLTPIAPLLLLLVLWRRASGLLRDRDLPPIATRELTAAPI